MIVKTSQRYFRLAISSWEQLLYGICPPTLECGLGLTIDRRSSPGRKHDGLTTEHCRSLEINLSIQNRIPYPDPNLD